MKTEQRNKNIVQFASRWILLLLICCAHDAFAVACDAVFTNGLQSHSSTGEVAFNGGATVTGGGSEIATPSMSAWGTQTCGGSACTASGTPSASSSPTFTVGSGSDGSITTGFQGATSRPAGDYGGVSLGNRSSLTFTTSNGTYLTKSFTTQDRAEIYFQDGDYWIDGNLQLANDTLLAYVGSGGSVRIFVRGSVTFNFNTEFDGFAPGQLLVYATGNINVQTRETIPAFLYAGGTLTLGFRASVAGGVSGAQVNAGQNTVVAYQPTALLAGNWGDFCSNEPPPPLPPGSCPAGFTSEPGLEGSYYDYSSEIFPSPPRPSGTATAVRIDGPVDFEDDVPEVEGLDEDHFAVRWDGLIRTTEAGSYRFRTDSDDGVRLWVGDTLVIDNWTDHPAETDTSDAFTLDANQTYAVRLEYYENEGNAVIRLEWQPPGETFGAIPIGPAPALGAGLYSCAAPPPPLCPEGYEQTSGLLASYFDLESGTLPPSPLAGSASAQQVDAIVDHNWGAGGPNIGGVGTDYFAVRWEGFVRAEQSGTYRFYLESDDGVAVWVDGERLFFQQQPANWWQSWPAVSHEDMWAPHSPTVYRSSLVELEEGEYYSIRMEYWEQAGGAVAHLRWDPPGAQGITTIPAGPLPELGAGLYHCSSPSVIGYSFSHATVAVTCEAQIVTVTAMGEDGPIAPPAGTQVDLAASSPTAAWLGGAGAVHVFTGDEDDYSFIRYLQQPQAGPMTLSASDGNAVGASSIEFVDAAFLFHGDSDLNPIPTQVSGVVDSDVIVRAVRTDDETGACIARIQGAINVNFGFQCINPATCVPGGPDFILNGSAIGRNNAGSSSNLTPVSVTFDGNGIASIPIRYDDVGRVSLHAQVTLPQDEDGPLVSVPGVSNEFVVKPDSIAVESVPGNTGSGAFVAASESFSARIEARNANGDRTPNFGNESVSEADVTVEMSLDYPAGGNPGTFTPGGAFTPVVGVPGVYEATGYQWSEVGGIRLEPRLTDADYLGAGDVSSVVSDPIGLFYPHHFAMTESSVSHSCEFTDQIYLGHRAIAISYTLEARNAGGGIVTNFDSDRLSAAELAMNSIFYAEESDITFLGSSEVDDDRVDTDPPSYVWQDGEGKSVTLGVISRGIAREAPLTQVRWGVDVTGGLGNRRLVGLDMDALNPGDCTADNSCESKSLTGQPELRFGRLVLNDSFGPESADLPVKFATEYWDGTRFVPALDDNCTKIPVDAIAFNGNTIGVTAPSRTVTIGGATTIGEYDYLDATESVVGFISGKAGHYFTASGAEMNFPIQVDLSAHEWLVDSDYTSDNTLHALINFGSYRGHDRIIYWQEVLN